MRPLLPLALVLAGCGNHNSHPPVLGPFADVKGTYLATVTSGTGIYASIAPGTTSSVTITEAGNEWANAGMSVNGYASYTLIRQSGGSFKTQVRNIGSSLGHAYSEIGNEPADLSSLTLDATESWNDGFPHTAPAGTLVYSIVKLSSG